MKENKKDIQCRRWMLTINNPLNYGFDHARIKEELKKMKSVVYWCMSDEIGLKEQKHHTHIYLCCSSGVRFSTIKNRFPQAHIDKPKGTSAECRDYIFKEGERWEKSKKAETNLPDTHEEFGELPIERRGRNLECADLLDLLEKNYTDYEIIDMYPDSMHYIEKFDRVRIAISKEKYGDITRKVEVTYIYGDTGTGKTSYVMNKYGYRNVYRITDNKHPFDLYHSEDVIIFEEFNGQFKIQDMLNYLDIYPLTLPARYNNKFACYTKIFIISNMDLKDLYKDIQIQQNKTWHAFLRRIHKVMVFLENGSITEYDIGTYIKLSQK